MRFIICDRCGKEMHEDDVRRSITVCRYSNDDRKRLLVMHCDRLRLISRGELSVEHDIDLCDTCKKSFVEWYGKAGIAER